MGLRSVIGWGDASGAFRFFPMVPLLPLAVEASHSTHTLEANSAVQMCCSAIERGLVESRRVTDCQHQKSGLRGPEGNSRREGVEMERSACALAKLVRTLAWPRGAIYCVRSESVDRLQDCITIPYLRSLLLLAILPGLLARCCCKHRAMACIITECRSRRP